MAVLYGLDQIGFDIVAAIGDYRKAPGNFHWCQVAAAQSKRQISWHTLCVDLELFEISNGVVYSHILQQADRHQIARPIQCLPKACRAVELARRVLGSPGGFQVDVVEYNRSVVEQGRWCYTALKSCEVQERFEG